MPIFIAASPKSGISSIPDLIARAKAKPNELSYASTGRGRLTHLTMELIQSRADVRMRLVPYAGGPAQAMGDAYLLPSIAAVVLGGTSILGGRGTYLGTVAGVILITLLQSILSVMQIPEAGRQIIYGGVIVVMLLLYGRERLPGCLAQILREPVSQCLLLWNGRQPGQAAD